MATLSVFMTYAQGLMEPVLWSVEAFADLISIKVNMERFSALCEAVGDVTDTPEVIEKYGDSFTGKKMRRLQNIADIRVQPLYRPLSRVLSVD